MSRLAIVEARALPVPPATIGEGPLYDHVTGSLLWVDIPAGRVWRRRSDGVVSSRDIGEPVGCVALCDSVEKMVLGTRSGIVVLDSWEAVPRRWLAIDADRATQCNDGRCDPSGALVVGTAAPDRSTLGGLYRVHPDGSIDELLDGVGMSNGLDWSPDGRHLYHVDSLAGTVTRYAWDPSEGRLSDPTPIIVIPSEEGLPDGLTVDADGCLWLAVWGAGSVRRYDPAGTLLGTVSVPTPHVTSCAFGGADRGHLYISTASLGVDPRSRRGAGVVFVARTDAVGQLPNRFMIGVRS